MQELSFFLTYICFLICFGLAIYGWQNFSDWSVYVLVGNAIITFVIHALMAIYYIGENK